MTCNRYITEIHYKCTEKNCIKIKKQKILFSPLFHSNWFLSFFPTVSPNSDYFRNLFLRIVYQNTIIVYQNTIIILLYLRLLTLTPNSPPRWVSTLTLVRGLSLQPQTGWSRFLALEPFPNYQLGFGQTKRGPPL